jgi:hypothetical protein
MIRDSHAGWLSQLGGQGRPRSQHVVGPFFRSVSSFLVIDFDHTRTI